MSTLITELEKLSARFAGEIRLDHLSRTIYSTDASVYQECPLAVALPKTEDDVRSLIRVAQQTGAGLIPRTAGTSLAGQVVGAGIVVDLSQHFTRILEINDSAGWVRVQPGVIRNELNLALEPHGMMFGPETATANRAMIGGMLGNNSCGANSIVYGSTRDQTLEITGFLSDGSRVTLGPVSNDDFREACLSTGRLGQIYSGINQIFSRPATRAEIAAQFPKSTVLRRNTGYALDEISETSPFCDSPNPLNLVRLIAGSEGTLFLATEIKLRCHPVPPPVSGLLCPHFDTIDDALRATLLVMRHQPFACELIDRLVMEGAARNIEQRENMDWIQGTPGAILIVEFRESTPAEVEATLEVLRQELQQAGLGTHFPAVLGPRSDRVWQLRKAGLGVVANVPGDDKPTTVIEDTAVALDDLPAYISEFNQLLQQKYGLRCVHYAHAGAGEIHLRPVLNLKTGAGRRLFRQVATDVAQLVKKYRGSLSGEHGDGRLRSEFLPRMIGPENYRVCQQIKQLFDPDNIFNPGKIVNAPPMDHGLRQARSPRANQIDQPRFNFERTGGVLGAAEMCSGSGDCRKTHLTGGTMCPSYMVTREEVDTTRARANVLRNLLLTAATGEPETTPQDVRAALDLCLSCKACKRECPSNVDMARLKAEFLADNFRRHGVPWRTRLLGAMATVNRLAAVAPWLYNLLMERPITSRFIKNVMGFHVHRSLPKLHRMTLRKWYRRHAPPPSAGSVGQAILFCDEFSNYYDVPVGIAAIETLETLGYRVELVPHPESGRAAISQGLLDRARSIAEANVRIFSGIVSQRKPLIGLEPSALLTFRDEYPDLLRGEMAQMAQQLAEHCLLFDEFVSTEHLAGKIRAEQFTDRHQTIRLHGHCHQKALASLAPSVRSLQLPVNYRVRLIPSGCCGMAGSFGYEKQHFDVSNRIGELVLMPTVREEPVGHLIAAAGTSCRHQILDATGRIALHPAQILRNAISAPPLDS